MARRQSPDFEQHRTALRAAAARLFAAQGYATTSIADVARACGVSKALIYHYYRDKEHLLHDIADSYLERLLAIVAAVAAEQRAPRAHLRRLIECFMDEYQDSAARHRVLVQDTKYLEPAHRRRVVAKQNRVVQAFADVVAELAPGTAAPALIKPLTMTLFGMMNWTFTWLKARGPLQYADVAPLVADLFLHGVAGVGRPTRPARRRPPPALVPRVRPRSRAAAEPLETLT